MAPSREAAVLCLLGLTARGAEVLSWVTEGKSNWEIGVILHIALRTVKKHIEHIFEKLGVGNRTCAAARAAEALRHAPSTGVLRDRLSPQILAGTFRESETITADAQDGKIVFGR